MLDGASLIQPTVINHFNGGPWPTLQGPIFERFVRRYLVGWDEYNESQLSFELIGSVSFDGLRRLPNPSYKNHDLLVGAGQCACPCLVLD